jgi:Na+/H+ antiporter NhaD/arsenite permease-like protein
MKKQTIQWLILLLIFVLAVGLLSPSLAGNAQAQSSEHLITGKIVNQQGQPIQDATITLLTAGQDKPLAETTSQPDGSFVLTLTGQISNDLVLQVLRVHFQDISAPLNPTAIQDLKEGRPVIMPDIVLSWHVSLAFWISTLIFVAVLVLIATGKLHNTLSALTGAVLIFAVSYGGQLISKKLLIFHFDEALRYVDWNVIFLIMGMMIVIAVVERTGLFQWLAFRAYRLSGGRPWLLLPILIIITGIASAFLDNVTTMLLMTPITIQIALAMGISPLALLVPEVMASNVVGVSTLIGTPTNILIGSYGGISFNAFLTNLTPGVLMALVGLIVYSELLFRKELRPSEEEGISSMLLERLEQRAQITEPVHLRKSAWVGAGMLFMFIFGEKVHLVPAVTALIGATTLLVWIRPDIEEMIEAVDWTTLVFFIALFIVVGAIQEVGLISLIASAISKAVGENLIFAMLAIIWASALLSTVIANIPFTAAMLPVVGYLTATIPAANSKVLFFCLSIGSAMGGNGSLIGASANMVTAGISERAGYPITYLYFLKKGLPALLITVGLATGWLLLRFLVMGGASG